MPIIVVSIPKGGTGKTTATVVLASELADKGATVAVIDADPNKNVVAWAKLGDQPENLTVIGEVSEDTIIDVIDETNSKFQFTIVDLEGSANLTMAKATSIADFIVIPVQGSHLDAKQAARQIKLIKENERVARRTIPYAVLLTRTQPAIVPKTLRHVEASFNESGIPSFTVRLADREAFRAMFSFGGTLQNLKNKGVGGLEGARENAEAFMKEVVQKLRQSQEREVV